MVYYIIYAIIFGYLFILDGTGKINFKQFIGVKHSDKKVVIIETIARLIFLLLILVVVLTFKYFKYVNIISIILQVLSLIIFIVAKKTMSINWSSNLDKRDELVTTGIFKYSRNPVYVAYHLLFLSFIFVAPLYFIIIYLVFALIFHNLILIEEQYLLATFKGEYRKYCKTRRYL